MQEYKDHHKALKKAHSETLKRAEDLEDAMEETFAIIYGFSLYSDLYVSEEIWALDPSVPDGEIFRIIDFDLDSDMFTITDGEFEFVMPLAIVKGLLR